MKLAFKKLAIISIFSLIHASSASSADHNMKSLEALVGTPRLAITDSPHISARCAAAAQIMLGLIMQKLNLTDPSMVPQKHLNAMETFMPFAGRHLRIKRSFGENAYVRRQTQNYLSQVDSQADTKFFSQLVKADYEFCMMWGYWNIQKYGVPKR